MRETIKRELVMGTIHGGSCSSIFSAIGIHSAGAGPSQFNTVHSIATDTQGNVYVGDRGNRRIQVFDNNGKLKTMFLNIGSPWAVRLV